MADDAALGAALAEAAALLPLWATVARVALISFRPSEDILSFALAPPPASTYTRSRRRAARRGRGGWGAWQAVAASGGRKYT